MLRKLYTNSGLILVAILAAGIWTSNIQDYLAARRAASQPQATQPERDPVSFLLRQQQAASPTPQSFDDFMRNRNAAQSMTDALRQFPAGAAAQCVDGSYSYSATRRGTCSGHGGVAKWLR